MTSSASMIKGAIAPAKTAISMTSPFRSQRPGWVPIAIEPMAFGCRRDRQTSIEGSVIRPCQPLAGTALLLGQTMIGWRVYDVMRTIDLIATRPEFDAARIGCVGISGGGTCTLFSAAVEPRIRAAFVSGYLNTFRDSVGSLSHCIDNYVPGILTGLKCTMSRD